MHIARTTRSRRGVAVSAAQAPWYETHQTRSTILRVFLQTTEPISAHELLCLVKKDDVFIGFTTVYRTLKTIVACGLGKEVISAGAVARYVHDHCSHRHLVCKDCGAAVDVEDQIGAYSQGAARDTTCLRPD